MLKDCYCDDYKSGRYPYSLHFASTQLFRSSSARFVHPELVEGYILSLSKDSAKNFQVEAKWKENEQFPLV